VEDFGVNGRMILKCVVREKMGGCGEDLTGGEGPVARCCVHGIEIHCFIKGGEDVG
jgi:alpha-D-ribose 1-methylphosphonate 5-triphosphate synthase subunit PhnG